MQENSRFQQPQGRDDALSALNVAIEALNPVEEDCSIPPAKAAFGSVVALLTMIRVYLLLYCDYGKLVYVSPGVDE